MLQQQEDLLFLEIIHLFQDIILLGYVGIWLAIHGRFEWSVLLFKHFFFLE